MITSAIDDECMHFFKSCHFNLAIDVSPDLFQGKVVGLNALEAMIHASLDM